MAVGAQEMENQAGRGKGIVLKVFYDYVLGDSMRVACIVPT